MNPATFNYAQDLLKEIYELDTRFMSKDEAKKATDNVRECFNNLPNEFKFNETEHYESRDI